MVQETACKSEFELLLCLLMSVSSSVKIKIPRWCYMIELRNSRIVWNGKQLPIQRFEVWFLTPFGMCKLLEEAVQRCVMVDLDPEFNVVPIPVAIAENEQSE